MKDIKCFIFDFGNVVAFFDHRQACRNLAKLTNKRWSAEDIYKKMFQAGGLEEQYDRGKISTKEFLTQIKKEFNIKAKVEEIKKAWCDIFWANDSTIKILKQLKETKHYKLILASNTNEIHYEDFIKPLMNDLNCFDDFVLSYKIRHRKPDPEFFDCCIEKADCRPSECVYVDDREDFVNVSCELGMNGIVVDELYELDRFGILNKLKWDRFGILNKLSLEDFDLPAIKPTTKLPEKETDRLLAIYKEKYANFRHFDTLRWQIPGLVFVVGGVMISFAPRKDQILPEPWVLLLYGPFVLLCAWLMTRISYHMKRNTRVLKGVAMPLGDHSIPISPGMGGAAFWVEKFLFVLGILATVGGGYLLHVWVAIGAFIVLLAIFTIQRVKWNALKGV